MEGFRHCFEGLEDPRTGNAGRHDLLETLMIAPCTVVSGGEDCPDIAEFARTKLEFSARFPEAGFQRVPPSSAPAS